MRERERERERDAARGFSFGFSLFGFSASPSLASLSTSDEQIKELISEVVKHGSLVGGYGDVNPRWWWLVVVDWFGFAGFGGFVVGVGRLD